MFKNAVSFATELNRIEYTITFLYPSARKKLHKYAYKLLKPEETIN